MSRKDSAGFTLVEVLISVFAIILLVLFILLAGRHVRSSSLSSICMGNLRQISIVMASYHNDYNDYPAGLPSGTLSEQLKSYIPSSKVFICPEDILEDIDSYSQFYVYRGNSASETSYILGCPRHKKETVSQNLFALGNVKKASVSEVIVDEVKIKSGEIVEGNAMSLADGSTINSDGMKMMLIQSFRMSNGVLYSIIRIPDEEIGQLTIDAIPGSWIEIVTPSAVAAVRGTTFVVKVSYDGDLCVTNVGVSSGVVEVCPLTFDSEDTAQPTVKKSILLKAGKNISIHRKSIKDKKRFTRKYRRNLIKKIKKKTKRRKSVKAERSLLKWLNEYLEEEEND